MLHMKLGEMSKAEVLPSKTSQSAKENGCTQTMQQNFTNAVTEINSGSVGSHRRGI